MLDKNKRLTWVLSMAALLVLPLLLQAAGNFWASSRSSRSAPTCTACWSRRT